MHRSFHSANGVDHGPGHGRPERRGDDNAEHAENWHQGEKSAVLRVLQLVDGTEHVERLAWPDVLDVVQSLVHEVHRTEADEADGEHQSGHDTDGDLELQPDAVADSRDQQRDRCGCETQQQVRESKHEKDLQGVEAGREYQKSSRAQAYEKEQLILPNSHWPTILMFGGA